jgi:HEPN domain-containing protein
MYRALSTMKLSAREESPMKRKGKSGASQEWLSHAQSDLRLAGLAAADEWVRREQACFHAQQAAKKALKAVLASNRMDFPFTHDIEELLEIAESSGLTLPKGIQEAGL